MTDIVSVQGLRKSYGGRVVVDDLDLAVGAGEILGLIGANGAGKTTTVECLQGLRNPDAGTIRVLGLDPLRDAEQLRPLVGSQLQDSALPDRMRVGEAVSLFSTGPNGSALLERFGLQNKGKCAFADLSGGERQRLFLVLALLNNPRLVILDELTQNLDPAARRDVWTAVKQLRDTGVTVLLVTHELEEAEVLCDRVVAMRDGRVLDQGTPAQLVARHGHLATMRFSLCRSISDDWLGVPGVAGVEREGDVLTLTGSRAMVAHVGARLVALGDVPLDLAVDMPNLEDALVSLLEGAAA